MPHSDGLPEQLPDDIGSGSYVVAYGRFARADALSVDHIEPPNDYVERSELHRASVRAALSEASTHSHFLFGNPGVLWSVGRFLYHYTTLDALDLIGWSGKLRLGPLSSKNDPREARAWRTSLTVQGPALGVSPTADDQAVGRVFAGDVDRHRRPALMVSFGTDREQPDGDRIWRSSAPRGYLQPRMWAQYGASHAGACIVLDRLRVDATSCKELVGGYQRGDYVKYSNDLDDNVGTLAFYDAGSTAKAQDHLVANADAQLFVKDPDWSSENEYRWIHLPDDESVTEQFISIQAAVVGLVVGDLVPPQSMPRVWNFANKFGIPANVALCDWSSPLDPGVAILKPPQRQA